VRAGFAVLLALYGSGPYVIQAAIADLHLREPRDWEEIALLFRRLEQITSSLVVTMNRAIAVAELEAWRPDSGSTSRLCRDDCRRRARPRFSSCPPL
jgi:predicted RNA polymerase sigma factor